MVAICSALRSITSLAETFAAFGSAKAEAVNVPKKNATTTLCRMSLRIITDLQPQLL